MSTVMHLWVLKLCICRLLEKCCASTSQPFQESCELDTVILNRVASVVGFGKTKLRQAWNFD